MTDDYVFPYAIGHESGGGGIVVLLIKTIHNIYETKCKNSVAGGFYGVTGDFVRK